jgi:hypothetical protein
MKKFMVISILLLITAAPVFSKTVWFLDVEMGGAWNTSNNIRIPGDTGTRFSLTDTFDVGGKLIYRFRAGLTLGDRHTLSLLAAPLQFTATGQSSVPIFFFEENFAPGVPLEALYRFNSWRMTYRYDFVRSDKWRVGVGFTAKIRDAEVRLSDGIRSSSKTDVGFVPLLNVRVEWRFNPRWTLLLHGDALASPGGQGRAEDVFLGFLYRAGKTLKFKAGYRIVEGGANVPEVYSFALIHYAVAGVRINLQP